ncbi:MAG: hypothetical protein IPH26_02280 [Sterolibacteriaceae bacterium]|uniref:Uncharacterized protein n=1 Tax=Candidatus Methylophosphatis roskildensis TaxID=2899263 RepID=A0A9D7E2Q1_9PROT|nr:hypothetical protein [Candidatus Methylophosphatis roskildensis]
MFAKASRSHWGIENGLRTPWGFAGQCRTRSGHSARNFSTLRKFVLATLRKEEGSKDGLAAAVPMPTAIKITVSP